MLMSAFPFSVNQKPFVTTCICLLTFFFSESPHLPEYLIHMNIISPNSDRAQKVYCGFSTLDYLNLEKKRNVFTETIYF